MHWKLSASENLLQYHLMEGQQPVATLKCNPSTGSLRLDYGARRLFFMNAPRGIRKRFVVTNEYGYEVAQYTPVEPGTGTLQLGEKTFLCTTDGGQALICNDRNEQLLQCQLPDASGMQTATLLFASLWLAREESLVPAHTALQPA